jgi:hypothetical protein
VGTPQVQDPARLHGAPARRGTVPPVRVTPSCLRCYGAPAAESDGVLGPSAERLHPWQYLVGKKIHLVEVAAALVGGAENELVAARLSVAL